MRTAICTINDGMYEAVNFEQAQHFEFIKTSLICPQCKEPAFFRGVTQNGRGACFGAKHKEGCTLATSDNDDQAVSQQGAENELITASQRIVVDFGLGLSPLLSSLIESEELRRSDRVIEVPGHGEHVASDFFVNLADVTDEHLGCFRGYWGKIHFAKADQKETLWLNTGDSTAPSVNVDKKHRETIYQRHNINDAAEISGAYILVFGEMQKGKNTDKKFVLVTDPSNITILLTDKRKSKPETARKQPTGGTSQKQDVAASLETIMELTFLLKGSIYQHIQSSNPERKIMDLQLNQIYNLAFEASMHTQADVSH